MAAKEISTKHLAISKANAQMVGIVAAGAFVTIFCLVASKAVFSQNRYQAKVINAQEKAHKQLQDNIDSYRSLSKAYTTFDSESPNVIGGNKDGTGDNDGPNSKIILDALPDSLRLPGANFKHRENPG